MNIKGNAGILLLALAIAGVAAADSVLVFGGTGQLGAPHIRLLVERGDQVFVFHRSTSSFDRIDDVDYSKVEGDLMDPATVLSALLEVRPNVVIDASARRGAQMQEGRSFYAPAMRNIVTAAAHAGVEQIVLHGSIGVRGSEAYVRDELGYNTDSANMRDKAEAEQILEESGIHFTIIRNGLLEFEPAIPTTNGILTDDQNTFGRITRTDLARLAVECVGNPMCYDKIYHAIDPSLVGPRPPRSQE